MSDTVTRYFTKDTTLAAWLYMNGVKLEGVTRDSPAQMQFIAPSRELEDLITTYQDGNPHGNIISFFRSYKLLLAQIKDR